MAARAQGNTCTILLPHYSRPTAQHSYVSTAASNLAKIKELTTCPPVHLTTTSSPVLRADELR